ncbi:MAG: DNA starvation/stationary phase protection protein Dps [Myxococcota bacterium]
MSANPEDLVHEPNADVVMHPTKHEQPIERTRILVQVLNERLAEAIDLHWQAKQAHWNVKGDNFIGLHELFDSVATHLKDHADLLAERAVIMGGQAEGTIQIAASRTTLPIYPVLATDSQEHVDQLSTALAVFATQLRSSIDLATELGDAGTADLLTEVSRSVDKDTWFVEAHLNRR